MMSLFFFCVLLLGCGAQSLTCNVTQGANGQTTYRIPHFDESKCQYSWTNASDFVLANQEEKKDELVLYKNETALVTVECINAVLYMRDCVSEGIERKATCNTNCTELPGFLKSKGSRTHEIVIYVFLGVFAVTAVAVLFGKYKIGARVKEFLRRRDNIAHPI